MLASGMRGGYGCCRERDVAVAPHEVAERIHGPAQLNSTFRWHFTGTHRRGFGRCCKKPAAPARYCRCHSGPGCTGSSRGGLLGVTVGQKPRAVAFGPHGKGGVDGRSSNFTVSRGTRKRPQLWQSGIFTLRSGLFTSRSRYKG